MNADEITKLLDALAARLGPAGQHIIDVTARQVVIDSAMSFVIAAALLGAAMAVNIWVWRHKFDWSGDSDFARGLGGVVGGIVVLLVITLVWNGASGLINPEYAVYQRLIGAVK